jgi:hypothetical protein
MLYPSLIAGVLEAVPPVARAGIAGKFHSMDAPRDEPHERRDRRPSIFFRYFDGFFLYGLPRMAPQN